MSGDGNGLPYLPAVWRETAAGVADTLGYQRVEDVLPQHRAHVVGQTGNLMEARSVVLPAEWEAALMRLCGWEK